jgi:putative transposase
MACFREDRDYLVYRAMLREAAIRHGCAIHAYCLMSNHVHLLITPDSEDAVAKLMHDLAQPYTRHFNRKYQRTGALWEGRFKSCVVQSGSYVLACYRYIEMNPVRAGMVSRPEHYPWSSYVANLGGADDLIEAHPEHSAIGPAAYASLIADTMDTALIREIRDATAGGLPLAGHPFKSILKESGRRIERRAAGRPSKTTNKSVPGTDLFSGDEAS